MVILFLVVCLVVAFLIFVMFLILKKTVRIVNEQTKSYFVNKLQGYDDLITERENRLNEIDELIKSREIGKEENKKELSKGYAFDSSVIDLFNSTEYQDKNIFELNRKIDENFVVNYEELVKDFLTFCDDSKDYEFCYTVLVALLAGHSHELYVANRETDMFVDGKIDMKGALAECLSWYRNVKKSDENISFESFKNFMLLDEAEKLNFDVITNRSNKNEFRKVVRAQEANINKRAEALMDSMNNIEEEFEGVKRRM